MFMTYEPQDDSTFRWTVMLNSAKRRLLPLTFVLVLTSTLHCAGGDLSVSLAFLSRCSAENESAGLTEPSGLALTHQRRGLWTVDDESRRVFQLDFNGEIDLSVTFDIDMNGFEGIAINPNGDVLYLVAEDSNTVVQVDRQRKTVIRSQPLSEMDGFDAVAEAFRSGGTNKGLEGITVLPDASVCVLKEGNPGLLLRISPDLSTIDEVVALNSESGFTDNDTPDDGVDFSGICFDDKRDRFWIVSDRARRLYLFNIATKHVQQSFALGYSRDGTLQEIKKAEGVAIDTSTDQLYLISDAEARLYIYQVH